MTLSPRQTQVMQLIAEGKTHKEIADLLCICPQTVRIHQRRAQEKLRAVNTNNAVAIAVTLKMVILLPT